MHWCMLSGCLVININLSIMKDCWIYFKSNCSTIIFTIVLMFFPFLFAFTAGNEDVYKRICINLLYALISGCVLMCTQSISRRILTILLTLIAFAPNIIVMSYLRMDRVIMRSTDFWVVFNTNPNEAINLFSTLSYDVYVLGAIYTISILAGLFFVWRKSDNTSIHSYRALGVISVVILLAVSFINPFRSKVPMIDFYKSFYKYQKEQREVAEFYANRQNMVLDVQRTYPPVANTMLFIIGESQNRQHMQLYGYPRPTNPLLSEIKDEMMQYTDVCSPAIHTMACMKQILSFSNHETPDMYKQEANIIEILRSGRYKTYWLDNQGETKNGAFAIDTYVPTSYRTMARLCDVYDEHEELDSVLIPLLISALQDTVQCKAIFLHLIGNHFDYSTRYEADFAYFKDTTGIVSPYRAQLRASDVDVINAYDNATRYNDYIIRTCIEAIRKCEGRSAMLYLSDHGEEVFDYQYYHSRSFEKISPAMCEPVFLFWMNEAYKQSNDLTFDSCRPFCTSDVIHCMMDIAGVKYHLYDSTRSIFSSDYIPRERYVGDMTFESIIEKYQK